LLAVILVVMAAAAEGLLFTPLNRQMIRTDNRAESLRTEIAKLEQQAENLKAKLSRDPDARARARVHSLQAEIRKVDGDLSAKTLELISPARMVSVLQALIRENDGLSLEEIRSEKPVPADIPGTGGKTGDARAPRVYQQGVTLVFRGRFSEVVRYLHAVEGLPWRLFWDDLTVEMERYPTARIRLRVHTLSLDEGWIGV
jgi:MSHA biogenesis protein MshJ